MSGEPNVAQLGPADPGAYDHLIAVLDAAGARYRVIDHTPEGRTERVSGLRDHPVAMAAKCLVVMVKMGRRTRRYFVAMVPGDTRVDLKALEAIAGGTPRDLLQCRAAGPFARSSH